MIDFKSFLGDFVQIIPVYNIDGVTISGNTVIYNLNYILGAILIILSFKYMLTWFTVAIKSLFGGVEKW